MLVLSATFALYDNPPRKTQAENINNVQTVVNQETPKEVVKAPEIKQQPTQAPQPKQAEAPKPKPAPQPKPVAVQGVTNCGDNVYKQYIYQKESGCRTGATNSIGCFGIGQDCNGIVRTRCGTSFQCQDEYFSDYAIRRYKSWANAYEFWVRNHWW